MQGLQEERAARHVFELAGFVAPTPQITQGAGDPSSMPRGVLGQESLDLQEIFRAHEAALDDGSVGHPPRVLA